MSTRYSRRRALAGLVLVAAAVVPGTPAVAEAARPAPLVRKSLTALRPDERRDYVAAVLALKAAPSPYDRAISYYDQFVQWHKDLYDCSRWADPEQMVRAHGGPMFLPWHREYLRRFELALREVSGLDVTIPYWDWTDPAALSSMLSAGFMGGPGDPDEGYAVTTGPFAKGRWQLVVQPSGLQYESSATPYLTRNVDPAAFPLPTAAEVEAVVARPEFDVAPWDETSDTKRSFRNALEGFVGHEAAGPVMCDPTGWVMIAGPLTRNHNAMHGLIGGVIGHRNAGPVVGTMVLNTSPNDPVFFLHHANIDRLWAQWQAAHPDARYLPRAGEPNNDARAPLLPWTNATPDRVWKPAGLGYTYAEPGSPNGAAAGGAAGLPMAFAPARAAPFCVTA